ncbi:cytochrome P450 [Panaeolus papilionaceus]|nr:cytochrome P450 [Panaeolus papilionaceus]
MYGEHTIILNRMEDTVELFERRSGLYSDRKRSTMTQLLSRMGWGFNVGLKPYGSEWRWHRKSMRKYFDKRPSDVFVPVQTSKVRQLLKDLLKNPEEFRHYTKRTATAIIMAMLYGFDLSDQKIDYFTRLSEIATSKLVESMIPGAAVVDALPFLRHIPAWFPGAQFRRHAAYVKKHADVMLEAPMKVVTEQSNQGLSGACVAGDLLEDSDESQYSKIKDLSATLYAVIISYPVTHWHLIQLSSAFATFFLAMLLFPSVQRKAQSEVDNITNRDRLPTFDDRPSLPYIEALMRELLRWRPPLPLNVPHVTSDRDVYKGYYIPKGTVVVANIWAMSRNEEVYPDPEEFRPERFLNTDGSLKGDDEFLISFGYGRRICPGKYIAFGNLYIMAVSVLATFDIRPKKGAELPHDLEYTDGMIRWLLEMKQLQSWYRIVD